MRLERVEETAASAAKDIQTQVDSQGSKILFYRHPMNPKVTSGVPAKDEMGMAYIPVYEHEEEASPREGLSVEGRTSLTLSNERQQLIGVTTAKAVRKNLNIEIRTVGKVAYDPELYNAITEYKEALRSREKLKDSLYPEARERAEALVQASALKLRLQGLGEEDQIQEVSKNSFDLTSLLLPGKNVWVYAQVYEYEVDLVQPGQMVTVTVPAIPGKVFRGKIMAVDPVLNAATRSIRVRAEIATPQERLRPEMFVHVVINIPLGSRLAIPERAVLDAGDTQVVFIKKGAGEFEPRPVRLGREAEGYYEVQSGLKEGEEVVTSANFLIDSESRFRAALETFSKKGAASSERSHHH
ncbi:MAG: efflux RND transporter periplasmic adaptor subunit [Elusimicrobia bacterium]|nr:efflux RND transporter periplasmic adaptor subunit [Elusimicrobiota bacterium]